MTASRTARVLHGATTIAGDPPFNSIHYQLCYPAELVESPEVVATGILPPAAADAPWPVLIWFGGVNVNIDSYRWLAIELASRGIAMLTFSHVGETTPGDRGLSPGIDIAALTPDAFGTRPSSTTLPALVAAVSDCNAEGLLQGLLDTSAVFLGGHSAGGTMALLNAQPVLVPGLRGAISYAGHTMPAKPLGHPDGTVLFPDGAPPVLLMSGSEDSVIARSAVRYGKAGGESHDPIAATFESASMPKGSTWLHLKGAGHLAMCDPYDPTSARGFLEPREASNAEHRAILANAVSSFIAGADLAELDDGRGNVNVTTRQ